MYVKGKVRMCVGGNKEFKLRTQGSTNTALSTSCGPGPGPGIGYSTESRAEFRPGRALYATPKTSDYILQEVGAITDD